MKLFEKEEQIYKEALLYIEKFRNVDDIDTAEYAFLANEYGQLLKQICDFTKLSDRTIAYLNSRGTDLLNKAYYDELTGVYNRYFFDEQMKSIMSIMSRSASVMSLLMLDIDFFKKYNDTYGHSFGDDCIREIAKALSDCIKRTDDFMVRYGGDEFTAVLPNTGESGARIMAAKMLQAVRDIRMTCGDEEIKGFTVSIGVTSGKVKHVQSGYDYTKRADEALYRAKQRGRDKFEYIHLVE